MIYIDTSWEWIAVYGQLDYVLMRNDIQSNKYLAGTFKNLYSDHRSLFLRIPLPEGEEEDDEVIWRISRTYNAWRISLWNIIAS